MSNTTGDDQGKPIWAKCEKTSECSFPMICVDLYGDGLECAYNPCTDDNSCAEGKTCDFDNLCDAQPCKNDDHCPEYYECKEKASWYEQSGCRPGNCVHCDFDKEVCKNDKCEPKPKVPMAAIIGGSVSLFVLIGICVAFFLFMRNKKKKEGPEAKNIENQEKADELHD